MVYTRLYDWTNDRDGGIKIRADRMDAEFDGIFTALNGLIDGTATWTGAIKGYVGTVSLPGYSFDGDTNTGIYRVAADQIGIALAGVQHADFATTGTQLLLKGAPTAGGTADALTVTWGIVPSALASGQRILFKAAADNTGAATLNLNGLGAKAIRKISGGTDVALAAADIANGTFYEAVYDSTANSAAGGWILITPNAATAVTRATLGLATTDSPQFAGIELGHATDTTVSRSAAGVIAVEGNVVPSPASQATGDVLYRAASSWSRLAIGTASQVLTVNAGATAPEWTTPASGATLGTPTASTSGTSIDYTSIPAGTKQIVITLSAVSTSGSSVPLVQIGDSGGIETTGYTGSTLSISTSAQTVSDYTNGIVIVSSSAGAGQSLHGTVTLTLQDSSTNTWVMTSTASTSTFAHSAASSKSLTGTLDRVRLTTANGTDTFDAGKVNILYQ